LGLRPILCLLDINKAEKTKKKKKITLDQFLEILGVKREWVYFSWAFQTAHCTITNFNVLSGGSSPVT
jgi:hypothetical protein